MPPKKGGKKVRKQKKGTNEPVKINPPYADEKKQQVYALATKMLGNRRLLVKCPGETGNIERMAIIPGKFKGRRNWITPGMVVMVNLRGYEDEKVDVIYVYNEDEQKYMRRKGEFAMFEKDEEEFDQKIKFGENDDSGSGEEFEEDMGLQKQDYDDIDLDEL